MASFVMRWTGIASDENASTMIRLFPPGCSAMLSRASPRTISGLGQESEIPRCRCNLYHLRIDLEKGPVFCRRGMACEAARAESHDRNPFKRPVAGLPDGCDKQTHSTVKRVVGGRLWATYRRGSIVVPQADRSM